MGMNLMSCCHKCKERVFHARGEEHKTMMPFYHRHRKCLSEDKYCMMTLEDQHQEEGWMRNDEYRDVKIGLTPLCSDRVFLSENATAFLAGQPQTRHALFTLAKATGGLRLRHEDGESVHYTVNEISMVAANTNNLNVILRDGRMIPVGKIGEQDGGFPHILKWLNRVNELIKSFVKPCPECGLPAEGWTPMSKIAAQRVCNDLARYGIDPETGHKMTCSKRRKLSVKVPSDGRLYEGRVPGGRLTIEIKGEQMDDVRVNRVLEEVTGVQVVKIDCDDYEKHGGLTRKPISPVFIQTGSRSATSYAGEWIKDNLTDRRGMYVALAPEPEIFPQYVLQKVTVQVEREEREVIRSGRKPDEKLVEAAKIGFMAQAGLIPEDGGFVIEESCPREIHEALYDGEDRENYDKIESHDPYNYCGKSILRVFACDCASAGDKPGKQDLTIFKPKSDSMKGHPTFIVCNFCQGHFKVREKTQEEKDADQSKEQQDGE